MQLVEMIQSKTNLLLLGKTGLPLLEDALELSRALLKTDNLSLHPDYLFISTEKKTIGVEEVSLINAKASMPPVLADTIVCVIESMEKMTVAAQNKMLLLLESNPNIMVIGICYKDTLLSTVKSRMRLVSYASLCKEDFISACSMSAEDAQLFFVTSEGVLALKETFEENRELFRGVRDCCRGKSRWKLLELLGLLKENDKAAITGNKELMRYVLRIMERTFADMAMECCHEGDKDKRGEALHYLSISNQIGAELPRLDSPSYTKNDFFRIVAVAIE